MNRAEALRAVAVAIDSLAEIVGELDGDKISDDLHEATAAIARALDVLRARPSTTELLAAVAVELDVEVHELGREATTRRVLDPEEREGLVVELADALGVAHAGVEGWDLGTLSIDPTEGARP